MMLRWSGWTALALLIAGCGGGEGGPPVDPSLRPKVERSTGWTFKTDPVFERIDRKQLEARLQAKLDGKPGERMAANGRALRVLGLLPKDYDLVAGLKRMYTEEILALYDLKDRKVYLVKEALEKPPSEEEIRTRKAGRPTTRDVTIAHEMVHALQHQHDPLLDLLEDTQPDFDDVRTALHALAEGEATVHMYALQEVRPAADLLVRSLEAKQFPGEPVLLGRMLVFPYAAGTRFAGVRAGNGPSLHARPPLSTEQILHPDRKDPPVAILLPDLSAAVGGGRLLTGEAVMGEAFLVPLLSDDPSRPSVGFEPSLAWGGDRLHLYEKVGTSPVVVVVTRWDTPASAAEARVRAGRKEGWAAAHVDLQVAFVVGLPADEGKKLALLALERAVAKPFTSVDELRSLRREIR